MMKKKETWQRGSRLSKVHAQELVNLYRSHITGEAVRAKELLNINKAHVLMLYRTKIISRTDARKILRILDTLERRGIAKEIHVDPHIGDLSTHMESYIISRVGEHIGGKIHTGRSRNDLYSTLNKMVARRQTLEIYSAVNQFIKTLLSEGLKYHDAVMPGYTHHSQHAQPITFGYFLVGVAEVFFRNLIRLENAYTTINKSPMGAAALATTGFQLDRKLVG
jgi:argininosuccinate lyase